MSSASDVFASTPSHQYWWTKKLSFAGLLLIGLILIVRLVWGWDANRRLERMLSEIKSRGEPLYPADFIMPHVPDEQNYVYYLKQAIAAVDMKTESPSQSDMEYNGYPPFPPKWYTMTKAAIEANPNAFKRARQARQFQAADWRIELETPVLNSFTRVTQFSQIRSLANLLADAALYEHMRGNEAESVELTFDLLSIADATCQSPSLVAHLVGTGVEVLAVDRLVVIAPELRVEGSATATSGLPVSREQIKKLIAVLLDERRRNLRRAMQAERMMILDFLTWYTQETMVLRPMYQLNMVSALQHMERVIELADHSHYWSATASFPPVEPRSLASFLSQTASPDTNARSIAKELSSTFSFHPVGMIRTAATCIAGERMSAIALAMALYRSDHSNAFPSDLNTLVPDYLPQVPVDPFSKTSAPIGYVRGIRPLLYSVGPNGVDDTVAGVSLPPEPQFFQADTPDIWCDLQRFEFPPNQAE